MFQATLPRERWSSVETCRANVKGWVCRTELVKAKPRFSVAWIVDRDLHPLDDRRLGSTVIGVVDPDHIRQKNSVETAFLQDLSQFYPRIELGVIKLAGIVTNPQSLLDV